MLSIHLLSYISVRALSYSEIIIKQLIHINLSEAYVIIMLVCRRLLTMCLPGKTAV